MTAVKVTDATGNKTGSGDWQKPTGSRLESLRPSNRFDNPFASFKGGHHSRADGTSAKG